MLFICSILTKLILWTMRYLKHDFLTIKKIPANLLFHQNLWVTEKHVAVFLCKLRIALSSNQLTFLFGVCEQTIANYINLAREDLHKNLVRKFINYNDRSVLIAYNVPMAKTLFDIPDDKTCSIFDATYRQSKNYTEQKQLWSEQKKMSLVKPMVGCSPDDWVLLVLGPFNATHNDPTYYITRLFQ